MHNPAHVLENNTHKPLWDFDIHTNHLISTRRPDLIIINKKKRTCKIVDFAVTADHRIKLKECETKDKYLELAKGLKKLWNMQVTIIPIVIGAFETVTKGLLKGVEEVGGSSSHPQFTQSLFQVLWGRAVPKAPAKSSITVTLMFKSFLRICVVNDAEKIRIS